MRKEGQNQRDEKKETNFIASDDGLYIYIYIYIWLLILKLSSLKNLSTKGSLKKFQIGYLEFKSSASKFGSNKEKD